MRGRRGRAGAEAGRVTWAGGEGGPRAVFTVGRVRFPVDVRGAAAAGGRGGGGGNGRGEAAAALWSRPAVARGPRVTFNRSGGRRSSYRPGGVVCVCPSPASQLPSGRAAAAASQPRGLS